FLRCLNQERKDVSDGAGKFRVFVQPFIGPGPFSIFSSFDHGFIAVLAIAALILYAVGVDAHFAKPFINAFSGIGVSFSSSAIISRLRINCSWCVIYTGHVSVYAQQRDDAYSSSLWLL